MSNVFSKHHLLPKSLGGGNDDDNIIEVTKTKHEAYNTLFGGNCLPEDAVKEIINHWFYKNKAKRNTELFKLTIYLISAYQR